MNNRLVFVLLLILVAFNASPVIAQEADASSDSQTAKKPKVQKDKNRLVSAVGELVKDGDEYVTTVDLGDLDVSTSVDVEITFKNPYDEPVRFRDVSKKCTCSAFRPKAYKIPAKGEDKVKLTIKVPARSRSGAGIQRLTFVQRGKSVIRAELKFDLNGVLAFAEPMGFMDFAADESEKEIQIPIVITEPVKLDGVTVECNLKDVDFEISPSDKGGVVTARVPDSVLSESKVSGEIYITSPGIKTKDGYFLVIRDLAKNVISPNIATFRSKDGQMVCTAIVQVAGRSSELPAKPIECRYQDQLIDADVKLLKKNTYRVQFRLSDELAKTMSTPSEHSDENAKPKELVWSINNGVKVSKQGTPFVIDQN